MKTYLHLLAALTLTMSPALAQRPTPSNDAEEASDSFYESLSTGEKAAVGLGILALCLGVYFGSKTDGNEDGEGVTQEQQGSSVAPPFLVDLWGSASSGGASLSFDW